MMSPAVAGAATLACSDISSTSTFAGSWPLRCEGSPRPGCQCPRYSPTLCTIRSGLLLTAPALAVGAQVERVAADADGVPDTAGVTRAVVEGDPAAGVAAGLEAARGAYLLALEERREDQHDHGLRAGLLRLKADGSVRSELERGGAGVQHRHGEPAGRRAIVRSGGHLAQVAAEGSQQLKIAGVQHDLGDGQSGGRGPLRGGLAHPRPGAGE